MRPNKNLQKKKRSDSKQISCGTKRFTKQNRGEGGGQEGTLRKRRRARREDHSLEGKTGEEKGKPEVKENDKKSEGEEKEKRVRSPLLAGCTKELAKKGRTQHTKSALRVGNMKGTRLKHETKKGRQNVRQKRTTYDTSWGTQGSGSRKKKKKKGLWTRGPPLGVSYRKEKEGEVNLVTKRGKGTAKCPSRGTHEKAVPEVPKKTCPYGTGDDSSHKHQS